MMYPIYPCGDTAVTIQIGNEISEAVNREVVAVLQAVSCAEIPGIRELVPSYTAVCVHYDPILLSYEQLLQYLDGIKIAVSTQADSGEKCIKIPVCYGGEYGPDLEYVAEHNGLTTDEVVRRHSERTYLVYMLGFLPGFAYMGGMDESISCPRLASPRTKIPAGSVGIAGSQTGIYPLASPGGWQLIGRTPVKMFEMMGETAKFTLSAGDRVQFVPISEEEFLAMEGQA